MISAAQVKKGYLCLAHGQIISDGPFRIDAKLSYSRESQETKVVVEGGRTRLPASAIGLPGSASFIPGVDAETFVMPLAHICWQKEIYTFCAVRIVSGKTHQIRAWEAIIAQSDGISLDELVLCFAMPVAPIACFRCYPLLVEWLLK